jgi:hypothetical protein
MTKTDEDSRLDELLADLREEVAKMPEGYRCFSRLVFHILKNIQSRLPQDGR